MTAKVQHSQALAKKKITILQLNNVSCSKQNKHVALLFISYIFLLLFSHYWWQSQTLILFVIKQNEWKLLQILILTSKVDKSKKNKNGVLFTMEWHSYQKDKPVHLNTVVLDHF